MSSPIYQTLDFAPTMTVIQRQGG